MVYTKWLFGKDDISECYKIRKEVFIKEQNCPEDEEYDDFDKISLHALVFCDEVPCGTCRIFSNEENVWHFGRFAVLKEFRGKGIGDYTFRVALKKILSNNPKSIELSGQSYLKGFYEKFGFKVIGDEYLEVNIPHVFMAINPSDVIFPRKCSD